MKRCLAVVWVLALASGWVSAETVLPTERPVAAEQATAEAPPVRAGDALNAGLLALKQNDFAALQEALSDDKDLTEIAAEWDERAEHAKQRRAEALEQDPGSRDMVELVNNSMQETWSKLLSDEGVDALVAEWQPEVADAASKRVMEFNLGFGALLTGIASNGKLSAEQVQQLTRLIYAVQDWTGRVNFADEARLRRAVMAIAQLARGTGLTHIDDVESLRFEEAVVHGDALIRTAKHVLAAYDIDADAILNSVRIEEHDAVGDRAVLRVQGRVFGVDLVQEQPMRYFNDRWMEATVADDAERWSGETDQAAEAAADASDEATTATATMPAPVQ